MSSPVFPDTGGTNERGTSSLVSPITPSGRSSDHLTPLTHSSMLSSRRWPADEPRPAVSQGTPTKRNDNATPDGTGKSELLGLDMSGSKIKTLTPGICRFTFLTELRLSNNFITRLPSGVGQLRSLAFLDLSNNQLTELPSEVGWLCNMKELLLFNNHIQDLPGEMGYLYQLENFGIEGNPINENLLQIVHSQGALALIPFLRDHMISTFGFNTYIVAIAPPSDRSWLNVDTYAGGSRNAVTVLCYNVLCDKYATSQMFGYVPSWFLNWDYRKQLILHEILSYDADIVCLQEVESSQFDQYFKPQLRMRGGYDGVFSPKSRARTMSEWDRSYVDGCATFFKADKYSVWRICLRLFRFKFEDKTLVEFNQVALSRPSLRKHKDMYNRVMTRDNIAVIVRLEHKESRQEVLVGNVHIHWDPSFRDVKLVQTIMLIEELEKISMVHPKAAIIVCGDFNSLPGSGVCSFLETGTVRPDHSDFMKHTYEPYTTEGASHSLNLKNAYSLAPDSLNFTSFTPMFLGVIDYVWFRPGGLSVNGCLGPVSTEYARQIVGLPSQHLPSDHISLLVEFKIESSQQSFKREGGSGGGLRYQTSNPDMSGPARRMYSRNKNAMT